MKRAAIPWNFQAVTLSSPGRNFTQFPSKDDDGDLDDEVLLHGVKLLKKIKGPTYRARSPGVGECRPLRATRMITNPARAAGRLYEQIHEQTHEQTLAPRPL